MRNIAFLLRYFPSWGGGETVTITLANEMVKRDYNVYILYFTHYEKGAPPFIDNRIHRVKLLCNGVEDKLLPDECSAVIAHNKIEYVVNQWWPANVAHESCKATGVKLIKCWHMPTYSRRKLDWRISGDWLKMCLLPVYRVYERNRQIKELDEYLKSSDRLVFLSEAFRIQYESMTKLHVTDKCCVIPNPIADSDATPVMEKKKCVIVVARMDEQHKKLSRVLKTWKRIQNNNEFHDWNLKLVGDGPDLERYKAYATKKNIRNISFEGFQNPVAYYREASIFLMTSSKEGFGMTLVEALKYGTIPIVMDTFLALHDIITDGVNGFITPDADIDAFTKRLEWVMSNEDVRRKMMPVCLKSIKKFSVKDIVDKWDCMLENL